MTTSAQDRDILEVVMENATVTLTGDMQAVVDWIADNMFPGEVFSENDLAAWAESNGYVKE